MQFYIIHNDPKKNAQLLPDYAIKRVNIREGWQIISDIGHFTKIYWEEQNKEYNPFHPNTMKFWESTESFNNFLSYYAACLIEYDIRFEKRTLFHDYFDKFIGKEAPLIESRLINFTKIKQTIYYLVTKKRAHLTKEECRKLQEILIVKE